MMAVVDFGLEGKAKNLLTAACDESEELDTNERVLDLESGGVFATSFIEAS